MQSGVSITVHRSPASVINPQVGQQDLRLGFRQCTLRSPAFICEESPGGSTGFRVRIQAVHRSPDSVIKLQINSKEARPDCSDLLLQCIPAHQHVQGKLAALAQGYK